MFSRFGWLMRNGALKERVTNCTADNKVCFHFSFKTSVSYSFTKVRNHRGYCTDYELLHICVWMGSYGRLLCRFYIGYRLQSWTASLIAAQYSSFIKLKNRRDQFQKMGSLKSFMNVFEYFGGMYKKVLVVSKGYSVFCYESFDAS